MQLGLYLYPLFFSLFLRKKEPSFYIDVFTLNLGLNKWDHDTVPYLYNTLTWGCYIICILAYFVSLDLIPEY